MIDKGLAKSPTTKIYLATPWFNDVQKERAKKAREYLNQNETVGVIHFPFDFQYKDATVDNDPEGVFGTPEWVAATFQKRLHCRCDKRHRRFLVRSRQH